MILTGEDEDSQSAQVWLGSTEVLVTLTGVLVVSAGVLLEDQSPQVCSVEAGSVLVLVIFTGEEVVLSAGVELEDQSSHVCSSLLELVESAGLLLVLVIFTGEEVVLSAGVELEDQSSHVCFSVVLESELVESAGLLLVLVILIGVLELLVVLSAGVELEDQSSQVCSSLELEETAGLLEEAWPPSGFLVVDGLVSLLVVVAGLVVRSAGLEDSATALLDQSFQPERA